MSFLTPARLTAIGGVVAGLAGVATALTGVVDVHSAVGQGLVAVGGYLTTAVSVGKFLEGQSNWETTLLRQEQQQPPQPPSTDADNPSSDFATNDTDVIAEIPTDAQPEPPRLVDQESTAPVTP